MKPSLTDIIGNMPAKSLAKYYVDNRRVDPKLVEYLGLKEKDFTDNVAKIPGTYSFGGAEIDKQTYDNINNIYKMLDTGLIDQEQAYQAIQGSIASVQPTTNLAEQFAYQAPQSQEVEAQVMPDILSRSGLFKYPQQALDVYGEMYKDLRSGSFDMDKYNAMAYYATPEWQRQYPKALLSAIPGGQAVSEVLNTIGKYTQPDLTQYQEYNPENYTTGYGTINELLNQ